MDNNNAQDNQPVPLSKNNNDPLSSTQLVAVELFHNNEPRECDASNNNNSALNSNSNK